MYVNCREVLLLLRLFEGHSINAVLLDRQYDCLPVVALRVSELMSTRVCRSEVILLPYLFVDQ